MAEYIDRQAVIDLVDKGFLVSNANYGSVSRIVRQIPAADVAPVKHGEWKNITEAFGYQREDGSPLGHYCSMCEFIIGEIKTNFCPNCGARLDGE